MPCRNDMILTLIKASALILSISGSLNALGGGGSILTLALSENFKKMFIKIPFMSTYARVTSLEQLGQRSMKTTIKMF